MTKSEKISKQIKIITDYEFEVYKLSKSLEEIRNEKQIAVSKENDLLQKKTFQESKLSEAYEILKEIISKGVVENGQ
ncbi:MAG: hypothetical protein PHE29_02085 [Tissierellia bacterium]|nr:hypothetical protein [Tissierellia bacterium]